MRAIVKRMFQSIVFISISVWLLLALLLYFYQPKLVFYPHAIIQTTPSTISLDYEDVSLVTADGEVINGWWIPAVEARATLLFLHGNAGNISHRLESIAIFNQLGLSVFIIDYRGYGKSSGRPSEQGTYLDAEAAWEYLLNEKGLKSDEIIVFGRSLGGAVATWLADRHTPAGLIIESSFTSIADIGKYYYPYLPTSLLARIKYASIERIAHNKSPLLVIHSIDDEIIPYQHGKALFAQAATESPQVNKMFMDIRGGHNEGFLLTGEKYSNGIDHFITDVLKR